MNTPPLPLRPVTAAPPPSEPDLKDIARCLDALGNPTRLAVFRQLVRHGDEGVAMGALQERTGTARSTLTHHVQKLMHVGLVTQERQGTTLLCRPTLARMRHVLGFLLDECCADLPDCCPGDEP